MKGVAVLLGLLPAEGDRSVVDVDAMEVELEPQRQAVVPESQRHVAAAAGDVEHSQPAAAQVLREPRDRGPHHAAGAADPIDAGQPCTVPVVLIDGQGRVIHELRLADTGGVEKASGHFGTMNYE